VTTQVGVVPHGVFKDPGDISDVNKRLELLSIYEARRLDPAIPGNDGTRFKISTIDSKRE
jgi:hypothetical protein